MNRADLGSPEPGPPDAYREYVGALHVHTTQSDGVADLGDLVRAAKTSGVDFVVMADHDTLGAREQGWEGWHDGVLLLAAVEISPRHSGHCLALGIQECDGYRELPVREYLGRVDAQGGIALAAHPSGRRRPPRLRRSEVWTEWESPRLAGMEVWSFLHDWSEGAWPWRVHEVPLRVLDPTRWLRGPLAETLQRWDEVGKTRRFVGVASLDSHEVGVSWLPWRLLSNCRVFRTIRTHVQSRPLLGDDAQDMAAVRDAIAGGRCHMANDWIADSVGFDFFGVQRSGRKVCMGQETACSEVERLCVRCPGTGAIRLVRDGETVGAASGMEMSASPRGVGVYRVEVRMNEEPWIFSNPIYLRNIERL